MSLAPLDILAAQHKQAMLDLVEYAGSKAHLAKMIGVAPRTVGNWVGHGRISMEGAYLVQNNEYLREHFPVSRLRPEADY